MALVAGMLLAGCGRAGEQQAAQPEPAQEEPAETVSEPETEKTEPVYAPESFDPETIRSVTGHASTVNMEDCDTLTQIVDRLEDGKGYTNTQIGEAGVLLVGNDLFEWEPGSTASLDAEIFAYENGAPVYLGYVAGGGTAYPLQVRDDVLYSGGNHYMVKYTVKDGKLAVLEEVYVVYDKDGNDTCYYRTGDTAFADHDAATAAAKFDALFAELDGTEVLTFDQIDRSAAGVLPAYEYPGPEVFYTEVYRYLVDEFGPNYPKGDVTIPCPVIVAEDDSNKQDILLYGDFWVFNYDLKGDTLECASGGAYPGVMHISSDPEKGYAVTGMDIVADGSDYTESAKKIFGKHYDEFSKINADDKSREETRAQIIANYVAANNLTITAYKDYGWDPVELPEENIDSFYSDLN